MDLGVQHLKIRFDNPYTMWYTIYEMREGKPKTNQKEFLLNV
jgi:hypothetical protein